MFFLSQSRFLLLLLIAIAFTNKFSSYASQESLHDDSSRIPIVANSFYKKTEISTSFIPRWFRLFTIANVIISDAKYIDNNWTSTLNIDDTFCRPLPYVDSPWSGRYCDGEILLSRGCFNSLPQTENSVQWQEGECSDMSDRALAMNGQQTAGHLSYEARWLDIGALICTFPKKECCSDKESCVSITCNRLLHQLARIKNIEYYTGRYKSTVENVKCFAEYKFIKKDQDPRYTESRLLQSVIIKTDYKCSNGLIILNKTVDCDDCPLDYEHVGFKKKNESHYTWSVKKTTCDDKEIDNRVISLSLSKEEYEDINKKLPKDDSKKLPKDNFEYYATTVFTVAAIGGAAYILKDAIRERVRFMRGKLIYKQTQNNAQGNIGNIEIPILNLTLFTNLLRCVSPFEGTFDLSSCGDVRNQLSINTGYKKGKIEANKDKVEIWFVPRFLIERDAPERYKAIINEWKTTPLATIGIFWTVGNDDNLENYDYLLITQSDMSTNLYALWEKSKKKSSIINSQLVEAQRLHAQW